MHRSIKRTLPSRQRKKIDRYLPEIMLNTGLRFNVPRLGAMAIGPNYFASVASSAAVHDLENVGYTTEQLQRILAEDPENRLMEGTITAKSRLLDRTMRYSSDRIVGGRLHTAKVPERFWDNVHKIILDTTILPISEADQRIPSFVPPEIADYFEASHISQGVNYNGPQGFVVGWVLGDGMARDTMRDITEQVGKEVSSALGNLQYSKAYIESF